MFFCSFLLDLSFLYNNKNCDKQNKVSDFLNQKKNTKKIEISKKVTLHFLFLFIWSINSIYQQEKWKNDYFEEGEGGRYGDLCGDQTVNNETESRKGSGVYNLNCTAPVDRMWNHIWIFLCLNIPSAVSFVIFYSIAKSMNNSTIENYDE